MKRGLPAFAMAAVVGAGLPLAEYQLFRIVPLPESPALKLAALALNIVLLLVPPFAVGVTLKRSRAPMWSVLGLPLGVFACAVCVHVVLSANVAINSMDHKSIVAHDFIFAVVVFAYVLCAIFGYVTGAGRSSST